MWLKASKNNHYVGAPFNNNWCKTQCPRSHLQCPFTQLLIHHGSLPSPLQLFTVSIFSSGLVIGLGGLDRVGLLHTHRLFNLCLSMDIEQNIEHRVLYELWGRTLWISHPYLKNDIYISSQAGKLSTNISKVTCGYWSCQQVKIKGFKELMDFLNFLFGLLGHSLFYSILSLNNRFFHPRLHMVEQVAIQASNFWTCAKGSSAADGGVDREKLGALLASWMEIIGDMSAGSKLVGSAPWDKCTISSMFSLKEGISNLSPLCGEATLVLSLMTPITTVCAALRSVAKRQSGTLAFLHNGKIIQAQGVSGRDLDDPLMDHRYQHLSEVYLYLYHYS